MPEPMDLEQLPSVVQRQMQRIAALELQVLMLIERVHALETQEEERQKLPFFQRKRAESDDFPPETP